MTQPSLFTTDQYGGLTARPPSAEQARDAAIDKGRANADQAWFNAVLEIVKSIARRQPFLNVDDVWDILGPLKNESGISTHDNRALAGVMRSAASQGYIEATDATDKSRRVEAHAKRIMRWRSKVFGG